MVNRLPLPGLGAPDLVLLLVTAIAVATSALTGAVSGFAAGLALDVAPPAAHYAGQDALVFCLAGYGAARVVHLIRDAAGERHRVTSFAVMAGRRGGGRGGQGRPRPAAGRGRPDRRGDQPGAAQRGALRPAAVPGGVLAGGPAHPGRPG